MIKEKGITLVALVITIIVLIILAGVSINLILGEDGIITKAKQAKIKTEHSKLNEEIAMNEVIEQWSNIVDGEIVKVQPGESGYIGGNYDDPYIPVGFSHIGEEDWNSGYRISDTGDETGNIFVWVPCVLDQSKVKNGAKVETFQKTIEGK